MVKPGDPKQRLRDSLKKKREYNSWAGMERFERPMGFLDNAQNDIVSDANEQQLDQDVEGLFMLLNDYGINKDDPNCWPKLSLALAKDYIPGFQMKAGKAGQELFWTDWRLRDLYEEVQTKIKKTGQTAHFVCFNLKSYPDVEGATIYRKYTEAKKKIKNGEIIRLSK
jgi:hypothetical protein